MAGTRLRQGFAGFRDSPAEALAKAGQARPMTAEIVQHHCGEPDRALQFHMTATPQAAKIPPSRALRIVLSFLAALESVLALSDLPGALSWHDAGFSVGQMLINANLVVHPLFALAALALAVSGRLRAALIVLAAYVLVDWLSEVPTLLRFGFEGNFTSVGISIFGQQVVFPLLAIAAIVLAAKNTRLWLAALFVALPPLNLVLGIVIFTISVLLYGF
jgi:hypothetical protein